MKLVLQREFSTEQSTPGTLHVDGVMECFTLEDTVRPEKIAGITAIPAGKYDVIVDWSHAFGCLMPRIVNVPGFEGIRIHPGNTAADTRGCILVGQVRDGPDKLAGGTSRPAYDALFDKLKIAYLRHDPITIEVKDAPMEGLMS